jgi:hypothetical protein
MENKNTWYYHQLLNIIADKLGVKNYNPNDQGEQKSCINIENSNVLPVYDNFISAYDDYSDYFDITSENGLRKSSFTENEQKIYCEKSLKMDMIRSKLMNLINKKEQ